MPRATPNPVPPAPVAQAALLPESPDTRPVHTIRHRSLKASIWENQTAKGVMYKVTVVRSYREGEEWHDTHSFGFDELMNVAKLFSDAHSFITAERAQEQKPAAKPARVNRPHR